MENDILILDQAIDDDSIRIWTCFTDKNVSKVLEKLTSFQNLMESVDAIDGQEWSKLPFWGKVRDWVAPGKNIDGTAKGWFEDRKFPTRVIKAAELTSDSILKAFADGMNVKVDYSGATKEQQQAASELLKMAFNREVLKAHAQAAKDASDIVGGVASVGGGIVGGKEGAAAAGIAAKGAVLNAEKELVVDKFNEQVAGTKYENLRLTREDMGYSWFDALVMFVCSHPYVSFAIVVSMVMVWKNRTWIWDRLKLGFNNLWKGDVIAKYQFKLVDGQDLSFEYDLRFNKWRLLYKDFKWSGSAYPSETMVKSFIKTDHCKKFIDVCKKHMDVWFSKDSEIRKIVAMNEDPSFKQPVKMILSVLDDKNDILRSFTQLQCKVG